MKPACQTDGDDAAHGAGDHHTTLKWSEDGELSPVDLQRVLERLTEASLTRCELEPGPSH